MNRFEITKNIYADLKELDKNIDALKPLCKEGSDLDYALDYITAPQDIDSLDDLKEQLNKLSKQPSMM